MIPYLKLAALGVSIALVGTLYHNLPVIGPGARIERLRNDRDAWKKTASGWEETAKGYLASYRESETLRETEREQSENALNEEQRSCDVRVQQARASAKRIKEIVYAEVPSDAKGCPVRGVVDAARLRDALGAH